MFSKLETTQSYPYWVDEVDSPISIMTLSQYEPKDAGCNDIIFKFYLKYIATAFLSTVCKPYFT